MTRVDSIGSMPASGSYNVGMAGNPSDLTLVDFDAILESLSDELLRDQFRLILNLLEKLVAENASQREEIQRLRDENNRLKGEQGKPQFKSGKPVIVVEKSSDHSSEKERRQPKPWRKGTKLDRVRIDREVVLEVKPSILPADAVFKGLEAVVVQDIVVKTDNIRFFKQKWYSASTGQTYLAELPPGYWGGFGPGVKSQVLSLHFGANVSSAKIWEFLKDADVKISAGTVSGMITKNHEAFLNEYEAIYRAGLESSVWHGTDHTPTTVKGKQHQCQVVGNDLYSIYATTPGKDRLSVLDVLCHRVHGPGKRTYLLNEEAHRYLEAFPISLKVRRTLRELPQDQPLLESVFLKLLEERLPRLGEQQFNQVCDAAAIAAYHAQEEWPIIELLLADDAPAFKSLTEALMLCWVHDGRHYKKLSPFVPTHRKSLETFRKKYWDYYDQLLAYREDPTAEQRRELETEFDQLFKETTGYQDLDERIKKTLAKKQSLLTVLEYPEVPLHNNGSERAARARARKRDVSFGPRTQEGLRAWDIFMSLAETARKLGVSFSQYMTDRISKANQMPALASLIQERGIRRARSPAMAAA